MFENVNENLEEEDTSIKNDLELGSTEKDIKDDSLMIKQESVSTEEDAFANHTNINGPKSSILITSKKESQTSKVGIT